MGEDFCGGEVGEVLVVGDDIYQKGGTFQVVSPHFEFSGLLASRNGQQQLRRTPHIRYPRTARDHSNIPPMSTAPVRRPRRSPLSPCA